MKYKTDIPNDRYVFVFCEFVSFLCIRPTCFLVFFGGALFICNLETRLRCECPEEICNASFTARTLFSQGVFAQRKTRPCSTLWATDTKPNLVVATQRNTGRLKCHADLGHRQTLRHLSLVPCHLKLVYSFCCIFLSPGADKPAIVKGVLRCCRSEGKLSGASALHTVNGRRK